MHDLPECLNRRYKALDELINELTAVVSNHDCTKYQCSNECNDASIKLMCEFWDILKEDPDCNLPQAVRQRMGLDTRTNVSFRPQRLACYMAEQEETNKDKGEKKKICCVSSEESGKSQDRKSESKTSKSSGCCSSKSISPRSTDELLPLSKVLCNLKEAVSFDKKCNARICELVKTQKQLQEQIQILEEREKEGTQLLKEAECMWSCMETAYKNKIRESLERQSNLLKQMKETETSNTKWRKNKKDLEFQIQNVDKCCTEIKEKLQEKTNDIKCIRMEIDSFKKRIANNIKQIEVVKKSFGNKKKSSDTKTASLSAEMTRARKVAQDEQNYKKEKENEGSKYIKEAREDLQKIYRLVLEKKLENEDLRAEKQTLLEELDLLKKSCEQCKDKCREKEKKLSNEITKINAEIAGFKVRCIRCHECTDTADVRKFCVDCPRCAAERECLYKDDHCYPDTAMDCVCMSTKQKFMDNVFDNMYSLLERKTKTPAGKAVANAVLECMKKSRNGKLNEPTRKILQEFILTTVKKNLNLTVVGGAVKTRCEMDPDTYNKLMLCLNMVQASKPAKNDKGTVPKKEPCTRWGDTSECNCPKGPKGCICTKKGLPDPVDPESCPSKDKDADEVITCPPKESASCECKVHGVPSAVGKEVASWKPDPCNDKKCTFPKNMRAAQCILGPDSLTMASKVTPTKAEMPTPGLSVLEDQIICKCGSTPTKPCACRTDSKFLKTGVEQCNKSTCAAIWEKAKSIDCGQINTGVNTHDKLKKLKGTTPDQDNISSKISEHIHPKKCLRHKKEARTEKSLRPSVKLEETQMKTDDSKTSFGKLNKKKIQSESEHFRSELTNITETPSGTMAMELDEEIIKQIEKRLVVISKVYVSIQKTDSGRHIVNFNPAEYSSNNIHVFKKSSSGSLLIEIDKNYVQNDNTITEESSLNSVGSEISVAVAVKLEHPEQDGIKKPQINLDIDILGTNNIPKQVCCSKPKLEDMHKDSRNDNYTKIDTTGNVREMNEPVFFKLLIKDLYQDLDCPLAVLKVTNSNNYIIDVDKEYEKAYKKTMKEHFGLDFEYPIEISKTSSGTIVIDFLDNKDINIAMPNALLSRSISGSIKIQTNLKRDFDKLSYRKSFSSEGKRPSEVFSRMLNHLTISRKESKKVAKLTDKKSSSDSNLLQKVRMKLQKQQNLLIESSAFLKRTTSGQYAVVLNKDSKKAFLNDLKNYVSSNAHGKVPIKRMEDGEIIIGLNNDIVENSKNGSLKITPSGNIYVLIDETHLNKITNGNENSNCISEAVIPKLEAGTSQKFENKTVTTTCNAVPSSCNSCDAKKCICGEVLSHSVDDSRSEYFDAKCVTNFKFCSIEDSHHDCKKTECRYKVANKNSKSFTKLNVPKENSPHIVIKQCTCHSNTQRNSMGTDHQLFYVSQSICPFHKDRYKAVSNELLEITGLCNKPQKSFVKCKDCDNKREIESNDEKSCKDYLKFLPPQLPPFLTGFRYE